MGVGLTRTGELEAVELVIVELEQFQCVRGEGWAGHISDKVILGRVIVLEELYDPNGD